MKISGSGSIPAGEYHEDISISGSGRIGGSVRCEKLHVSGSAHVAGRVTAIASVKASGSLRVDESVEAAQISCSGSMSVGGDCVAKTDIKTSGHLQCEGVIHCVTLSASGRLTVKKEIEAEKVLIGGALRCDGLVNAEEVEIRIEGNVTSEIGSIGAGVVKIYRNGGAVTTPVSLPLFSKLVSKIGGCMVKVKEAIEGDIVAVEYLQAPKVIGKTVSIGPRCVVDLVQYSDEIEIHPDAVVGKCEKI